MTVFSKIALGCLLGLALLLPWSAANAASSKIVIPPRVVGPTVCDTRGCFGFGSQQWYRRSGTAIPNTTPSLGNRNRYEVPRVFVPPRNNYVPPKTNYQPPVDNRNRHRIWCADRYRSYNPQTNRYTTLRNGSQVCRSPWG